MISYKEAMQKCASLDKQAWGYMMPGYGYPMPYPMMPPMGSWGYPQMVPPMSWGGYQMPQQQQGWVPVTSTQQAQSTQQPNQGGGVRDKIEKAITTPAGGNTQMPYIPSYIRNQGPEATLRYMRAMQEKNQNKDMLLASNQGGYAFPQNYNVQRNANGQVTAVQAGGGQPNQPMGNYGFNQTWTVQRNANGQPVSFTNAAGLAQNGSTPRNAPRAAQPKPEPRQVTGGQMPGQTWSVGRNAQGIKTFTNQAGIAQNGTTPRRVVRW